MITPCMTCTDRKVGCHSKCEKYKEFQAKNNENRTKLYKYRLKYGINSASELYVGTKRK